MVPDLVLICENMLMAEGFVSAKVCFAAGAVLHCSFGTLLHLLLRCRSWRQSSMVFIHYCESYCRSRSIMIGVFVLVRALACCACQGWLVCRNARPWRTCFAVKSVLVVAGGFKRAEPELPEQV